MEGITLKAVRAEAASVSAARDVAAKELARVQERSKFCAEALQGAEERLDEAKKGIQGLEGSQGQLPMQPVTPSTLLYSGASPVGLTPSGGEKGLPGEAKAGGWGSSGHGSCNASVAAASEAGEGGEEGPVACDFSCQVELLLVGEDLETDRAMQVRSSGRSVALTGKGKGRVRHLSAGIEFEVAI